MDRRVVVVAVIALGPAVLVGIDAGEIRFGAGVDGRPIRPRVVRTVGFATTEDERRQAGKEWADHRAPEHAGAAYYLILRPAIQRICLRADARSPLLPGPAAAQDPSSDVEASSGGSR